MQITGVGTTPVHQTVSTPARQGIVGVKDADRDRDNGVSAPTPATRSAASQIMQQLGIGRNIDITG